VVRTLAPKLAQARKRAALRAVVWSLVRQQGYMLLAQIEGELHAPDASSAMGLVLPLDDDLTAT
jgi:hypothetical protein